MKKVITIASLLTLSLVHAQAFKGKGDDKFSLGANLQDGGTGINLAYDFGVGSNMSFGLVGSYLIGVTENQSNTPDFGDRIDVKARLNANLCDVIGVQKLDVYPGLNIGLRNFGGHVGARYFFTDGFGVFSEAVFPIAKYDKTIDASRYQNLNNQLTVNIGAVFTIN